MSNIIDSIQLSGVTYTLQGSGGGTVDSAITSGSTNPVENQALWDELRIPKNEEVETVLEWENNDGGATTNYPTGASKLEFYIDENEMTEGYFYFKDDGYNELGKIFIEISNGNISVTDYENVTYTISGDVVTVNYSSIAASVVLIYSSYDCNWTVKAYTGGIVYEPIIDQVSANTAAISGKVDTSAITSSVTSASTDSEIPTAKAVFDAIPTGSTSGNPTVELTQAEYDALVSAGTVSANTYYIITDATPIETSGFVQTSAITSSVTSASTDSQIPTAKAVWEAASGGGTTYTAGRGIDITNDTISVSLPISAGTGSNSIAEGDYTIASGSSSHAEGRGTTANGNFSHAEGNNTQANGNYSHAEGRDTIASGYSSHAEGNYTSAMTEASHAEGMETQANGNFSHAEGYRTTANGNFSHAEGNNTQANGNYSHAEGWATTASGQSSHAEGESTVASGARSHAEGLSTRANGNSSHAEGRGTTANTDYSHAEGTDTTASGYYSHAEGNSTVASGSSSHAEGLGTQANGAQSHAEGNSTQASGYYSHAEGYYTIASNDSEHASGQYNVSSKASDTFGDSGNTLFSVGNGTSNKARHNAFEIRQNGDIYLSSGGTDIKLQDYLGGGSITVDTALDSASTNPVENRVIYNKIDEIEQVTARALNSINDRLSEDEEVTAAGLNAVNDKFGGLKLQQITQSDYNNLQTKDPSTLYIIVN